MFSELKFEEMVFILSFDCDLKYLMFSLNESYNNISRESYRLYNLGIEFDFSNCIKEIEVLRDIVSDMLQYFNQDNKSVLKITSNSIYFNKGDNKIRIRSSNYSDPSFVNLLELLYNNGYIDYFIDHPSSLKYFDLGPVSFGDIEKFLLKYCQ